jgi:hypothetical protein
VQDLLAKLKSQINYPQVAQNVAKYNHDSMKSWTKNTKNWQNEMGASNQRWHDSWSRNAKGSVAAVNEWLAKSPQVEVCRHETVWPAPSPTPSPSPRPSPSPPSPSPSSGCTFLEGTALDGYTSKEDGASKEDCCKRCQEMAGCSEVGYNNGKCKYGKPGAKHVANDHWVTCVVKSNVLV